MHSTTLKNKFFKSIKTIPLFRKFILYVRGNSFQCNTANIESLEQNLLIKCTFYTTGGGNIINLGRNNSFTNCKFHIQGNNCTISLGENNSFRNTEFWIEDNNSSILIGDSNVNHGALHIGIAEGTTFKMGDECLLAKDIHIATTDSHSIIDQTTGKRINPSADVTIGNHVWICRGVSIGKGVTIPSDVVIAALSYVNKPIKKSNVIVAGIPAKIINEDINWQSERI